MDRAAIEQLLAFNGLQLASTSVRFARSATTC
jgi:hypothetical protein